MAGKSQTPWDLLGLPMDCTERDIRSAYARRLKVTRPDDDPVAFQRLVEARDITLSVARGELRINVRSDLEPALARGEEAATQVSPKTEITARTPAAVVSDAVVSPAPAPVDQVAEAQSIVDEIARKLDPVVALADLEDWPKWVAAAGRLDHYERLRIEPQLLRKLPVLLPGIAGVVSPYREDTRLDWLPWRPHHKPDVHDRQRAVMQRDMVLALDEDFGWTRYDRQVYAALHALDAQSVLAQLKGLRFSVEVNRGPPVQQRDSSGIVIFSERDLRSYFGAEYAYYQRLYLRARELRRWPAKWNYMHALLAPIYALQRRLWLLFAAWLLAALFVFVWFEVPGWHSGWLPQDKIALNEIATLLPFVPLLLVHLWSGLFSHRAQFGRAARVIAVADRHGVFEPRRRAAFLANKSGPRGTVNRRLKWVPSILMIGLFIVLRLLMNEHNSAPYNPNFGTWIGESQTLNVPPPRDFDPSQPSDTTFALPGFSPYKWQPQK